MNVTTLGIDVAKTIFQLHGLDARGHVAVQQRVTRGKLQEGSVKLLEKRARSLRSGHYLLSLRRLWKSCDSTRMYYKRSVQKITCALASLVGYHRNIQRGCTGCYSATGSDFWRP